MGGGAIGGEKTDVHLEPGKGESQYNWKAIGEGKKWAKKYFSSLVFPETEKGTRIRQKGQQKTKRAGKPNKKEYRGVLRVVVPVSGGESDEEGKFKA